MKKVMLFKTHTCRNCITAEKILEETGIDYSAVYADEEKNFGLVKQYGLTMAPTLVVADSEPVKVFRGVAEIIGWIKSA